MNTQKLPKKAQRVVATAKGHVSIVSLDLPPIGSRQVLIETEYSTISPGTELAFIHNKPGTPGTYPTGVGYSACCRVLAKGDEVTDFEVGQRIVCNSSHLSHNVIDAERCRTVSDKLPDADASAYRLASIALQGVRKCRVQLGSEVAVLGLGPIGNLAGQLSRAAGATYVEGIDPVSWRRELALQCGFNGGASAAAQSSRQEKFDRVIEASGIPEAIPAAFGLAGMLGHVTLLGSTRGETQSVDFYSLVHKKGLTVVGAHESIRPARDSYMAYQTSRRDEETVLRLLEAGRIQVRPLLSDVMAANDAPKAYERLLKADEKLMLIVLKWK